MSDVFRHAWWAFAQVYYDLRALAIRGNLWWFVTVFPLFPIVGIPLASALQQAMVGIDGPVTGIVFFIFIVAGTGIGGALAGPGTAGLFYVAQLHVDGEDVAARDFWIGFRSRFFRAWLLFVVDIYLLYGLVVGFIFYTGTGEVFIQALGILSLYFIALWVAAQAYLYPLALRYEMSIYHVFRNAAVLALSAPASSLAFCVIVAMSLIVSMLLVFPMMVVVAVMLALVSIRMTDERLIDFGLREN
tara:strand:- start:1791 stop:2525 length:735 start_codon:yes stop_codon:yes gene_type:complete